MNISQMHQQFKLLCDKTDSLSYDEFTPKEIDFYINKGQEEFVKTRYKEFEQSQKRRDDLRVLDTLGNSINLHPLYNSSRGEYVVPISAIAVANKPYLFFLSERISFTDTTCNKTYKNYSKLIAIDQRANIVFDPFNRPEFWYPVRIDREDGFILDFGTQVDSTRYTPFTYQVTYLRYPVEVSLSGNVSCELAPHTHIEILNLSVRKALENIESYNRYQSQSNEINHQE